MTEVKALFPIGKTQWAKWNDWQRAAFNDAREAGVPFADAVEAVNRDPVNHPIATPKKKSFLDVLDDVVETVADVAETATPVIAVAKTVAKVAKGKKGK